MGSFTITEWLVVAAIVLVLFGGKKLPALGAGLGKAIKGFKDAVGGGAKSDPAPKSEPPPGGPPQP
jgi:sec-independent protein translocase protein TatA